MILQNVKRRVVGSVLNKISSSNTFPTLLSLKRFHKKRKLSMATKDINTFCMNN